MKQSCNKKEKKKKKKNTKKKKNKKKKKKKNLNLPSNGNCHCCQRTSSSLTNNYTQHIKMDNNLLFPTCYNFFIQKQLAAKKIEKLNVPTINNNKYYSLY